MKKYNTPEMMVSLFENEAVETAALSTTFHTYNEFVSAQGATTGTDIDFTSLSSLSWEF